MSALAAVWRQAEPERAEPDCQLLLSTQAELGPDGYALHAKPGLALGRQLWRLLPEDDLDQEVHVDLVTGLTVIADVRLDYPAELAASLGLEGMRCADSYLVFAAYRRWGAQCVEHLHGDFAFVAWEARHQRLVMARDFLGGRPLFFHHSPGLVMAASLPRALAAVPRVCPGLDHGAFVDRLALVQGPSERTLWQDIYRLPPGQLGIADGHGVKLLPWWDPKKLSPIRFSRSQDYVDAGRMLFEQAVHANLRARGPIGVQLSAGLDSGGIATTAAKCLAERGTLLHAYTFRPQPSALAHLPAKLLCDESVLAAEVARPFPNIRHHPVIAVGRHLLSDQDAWSDIAGEPFLNPINLGWIHAIHSAARNHGVSVLLTGVQGNLTLTYDGGGFSSYALALGHYRSWFQLLGLSLRHGGGRTAGRLLLHSLAIGLQQHAPQLLSFLLPGRLQKSPEMLWHGLRNEWLSHYRLPERHQQTWEHRELGHIPDTVALRSRFLQIMDLGISQKAVLALHAQDMRNPLVNRRLVEFCLSIPDAQYCQGIPRSLARRIFADRLPESVCQGQNRGVQGQDFHLQLRRMLPELQAAVSDWEHSPELVELLDIPRFSAYLNQLAACDDSALARQNTQVNAGLMRNIATIRFVHRTLARLRAH